MSGTGRVRTTHLARKKAAGEKIPVLTAYDATTARLLERAGVEVILVGDSLGMVVLGYESTVAVTMSDMLHHTKAVSRGARRALVVADMPFLSYQVSVSQALENAGRLLGEGGAAAVKLEGPHFELIRSLVRAGIPVAGHLGLLPQHVHQLGGYPRMDARAGELLLSEARAMEAAGAFALVLESVPVDVAGRVSKSLAIPTIGIGSGPHCDGQVLVLNDVLGLTLDAVPPFARQYAGLGEAITEAARRYSDDVRAGLFPKAAEA